VACYRVSFTFTLHDADLILRVLDCIVSISFGVYLVLRFDTEMIASDTTIIQFIRLNDNQFRPKYGVNIRSATKLNIFLPIPPHVLYGHCGLPSRLWDGRPRSP
jgi:hypothetical protein